jgi:tRNA threonylcarbamoyladenosine biosynthesis protein TsaE
MTDHLEFTSHSPEETQKLGKRLGELALSGDIFLLSGKLGAGKTCLTQGIARGLGITESVLSPSFVLVRELKGRLPLYHADLYRLDNIEEISELGLDEYLFGKGLTVIEWANKGLTILPEEHLLVEIDYLEDDERRIKLTAKGKRYQELMDKLKDFKVE